jgi:hypothetical protein
MMRWISLAFLASILCGCATSSKPGTPPLERSLPTQTCEKILAPVAPPAVTAQTDARTAFLRDDGALINANNRINAARNCIATVRKKFAQKGK